MDIMIKLNVILFLAITCSAGEMMALPERFYLALSRVESNNNDKAIGRAGEKGRYQISFSYWHDSVNYAKIGGKWEDCLNKEYSEKIITAYMNLYGKKFIQIKDYQRLARIHNGGLNGHRQKSTLVYWRKVQRQLNRI